MTIAEPQDLVLPPSGAILGRIVSAFRLSHPDLGSGTAVRYFRGEAISESNRRLVLRKLARVVDEAGLLPRVPFLEDARARGRDPSVILAYFLLNRARDWDMQRARIGMWGMKFLRPELIVATLMRQAALDISVRLAAYCRAAGVRIESEHLVWLDADSRKLVFREYLEVWDGPRPSLEKLADESGLGENTIDSWLYDGVRPRKDNLRDLCVVLAAHIPGKDEKDLQTEINIKLALATLFDALCEVVDGELAKDAFDHAVRYCHQLTQSDIQTKARLLSGQSPAHGLESALTVDNAMSSEPLVTFLIARERSWVWRNLLLGFHLNPYAYWEVVSVLSGSEIAQTRFQRWIDEGNAISDEALAYAAGHVVTDIDLTVSDMASFGSRNGVGQHRDPDYEKTLRLIGADAMEMLVGAERSIAILQQLIQADDQSAFLHWRLGKAFASAGRMSDATLEYLMASALAPGWEVPWSSMAIAQIQSGEFEAAFHTLKRAFDAVDEPGADLCFAMGGLELINKNYARAYDLFSRAISLRPNFGSAHELLARSAWRMDNRREARRHMRRAYQYGLSDNILPAEPAEDLLRKSRS